MRAQADAHGTRYLPGRQTVSLDRDDDGSPVLGLDDGTTVHAGAVVLTAGIGTFTPRRFPAGEAFPGAGVSTFVTDPEPYRGRDVLVVGGGDSAVDWALMLHPLARSLTLVHRRSSFRAHAASVRELQERGATILTDAEVVALAGDDRVRQAHVQVGDEPGHREIAVHEVVAALGFVSNLGPLAGWGLEMSRRSIVVVDGRMRTSAPRVFAAGDVTEYPGKVRLMAVGFGEVATAIYNAAVELDPSLTLLPGHSTEAA